MKKITIQAISAVAIALAAALPANASPFSPILTRTSPPDSPLHTKIAASANTCLSVAKAASYRITVSITLDQGREQEVQNVLAISTDSQNKKLYQATQVGSLYQLNADPGVYDVVAFIKSDDGDTQILLFEEDVDLSSNQRIMFNQRNAKIVTRVERKSPAGGELTLPSTNDPGDCSIADHVLMFRHNDFGTIVMDETVAFRKNCSTIATNLVPKRFTLTRMDAFAWEQGPVFMVIPIDLEKEFNGPTDGGWQSVSADFAQTPLSKAWLPTQPSPTYSMTGYLISADNKCCAYVNMGNYKHEFPTDRCYYWSPEGYDKTYEYYPVLRDGLIVIQEASVSSMPYRLTPDRLVPSGLNLICSAGIMLDDRTFPDEGHPEFSSPLPDDARLANAVPALVCIPGSNDANIWNNGFQYGYTGRYGEELGINACVFSDEPSPEELDRCGGYRRSLSVTCDDREICSDPADFSKWLDWGSGDSYEMQIEMSNVLIDNSIEGVNKASLSYKASDKYIPTVTALQLRDKGKPTDRFASNTDASLVFTAATLSYVRMLAFDFKAPSAVRAEYAPHGSNEFEDLEVSEVPENFYMPGYGNYYIAPLDIIDHESDSKWYDLRISVEGDGGAVQTQLISPAFRLEALSSSVGTTIAGSDTRCDVYSTDGRTIALGAESIGSLNLEPGIYIVKEGGSARKVRID